MGLPISYNLRSIRQRWPTTMFAVAGIGLTVLVFVVLLAMADGFRLALRSSGSPRNAVVFQRGSNAELTSWISLEHANRLAADSRVARGADGQPLASCETVVVTSLPRRAAPGLANVTFRGATARTFELREGVQILEGRRYQPALHELIVGRGIRERIEGLEVGRKVRFQKQDWEVVGVFAAEGSAFESEVWGDADVMRAALQRYGGCNALVARVTDAAALASLARDTEASPELQLQVKQEQKYYEDQSAPLSRPLTGLVSFVSIVMGIGAVFGAMNTMYAVVSARTREIATLRVLGFSRRSILVSFSCESVLLALVGGLLGCALALPANALSAASGATAGFAELTWGFRVTPSALAGGLAFAVVQGFLGGLLPAIGASRIAITAALRES